MKGHIRERSAGHFAIVLEIRDPETGKRKRKWHSFEGTKREAQIERSRLIAELTGGAYVEPARTTLAAFLDRWLDHVKTQVSPRSYERYCELARKNIMPLLGGVMLSRLQPAMISRAGRARTVALSETMVEELRAHRLAQTQELLRLGVRISDDTFVVAQVDGNPLQPRSITHEWVRLISRAALPRIRFHDLRHAHATHLLASGVHPKVASERLGHSQVGITLNLYSHVLPGMQADAASRVDVALRAALNKRREK